MKNHKKKFKNDYKNDFKNDFNEKKNIFIINKCDYYNNIKYDKKNYLNKDLFCYNCGKLRYLKSIYKNKFSKRNITSIISISLSKKIIIYRAIIFPTENIDSRKIYEIV